MLNKEWISQLAGDIETKYGKETRERIFGDIESVKNDHDSLSAWFGNFIRGIDELNDKEFLTAMLAERCPCGYSDAEKDIKKLYKESKTLEEFVTRLDENGIFNDKIKLRGNILYATKQLWSDVCAYFGGKHNHKGFYTESCHCPLASHTEESISDIFCHCCTVGYYSKMFKNALGVDVKVEFIDSVIIGGKGCTAAIYLPAIDVK